MLMLPPTLTQVLEPSTRTKPAPYCSQEFEGAGFTVLATTGSRAFFAAPSCDCALAPDTESASASAEMAAMQGKFRGAIRDIPVEPQT